MLQPLAILALVLLVVGFSMVGFAREPSVIGYAYHPDLMLATVGTSHEANMDRQAACGIGKAYSGMVSWVDPDQQTMMVSGLDGSKIFDVSKADMKGLPEADHYVTVMYTVTNGDRIASSVTDIPQKLAWMYVSPY